MPEKGAFNTPKNLAEFAGQFVVFFSEDENPTVLFNSYISEEAYNKAEELTQDNRKPIVMRIQENPQNNIAQVLALR